MAHRPPAVTGSRHSSASRASSHRNAPPSSPIRPSLPRTTTLWTHDPSFSTSDVVVNPDSLPEGCVPGSLIQIIDAAHGLPTALGGPRDKEAKKAQRRSLVVKVPQRGKDKEVLAKQPQIHISISKTMAAPFGLSNRSEVYLTKVSRRNMAISHVEIHFRDQYIGRSDMWRMSMSLEDTCVYVGQKVVFAGCVRATIKAIYINAKRVSSGYMTSSTRTIFRSESAKYYIFIQLSREMWEFDEDGELYYEKAVQGFLPDLLHRWRMIGTNHVVTVVLFARVLYYQSEAEWIKSLKGGQSMALRQAKDGSYYKDFFKVIVDLETSTDWGKALTSLKEEFFRFQHDVLLIPTSASPAPAAPSLNSKAAGAITTSTSGSVRLAGHLSFSFEGSILEAINLALNPFDEHYIDRDLLRTGLSMLVVTAGTGHFEVDKKLLRLTTERMIDNGIGLDVVCLTKMPLHSVPLFHFRSHVPELQSTEATVAAKSTIRVSALNAGAISTASGAVASGTRLPPDLHLASQRLSPGTPDPLYFDAPRETQEESAFYSVPYWVDCSFYNLQQDKPFREDRFVPRCKMHEVQMRGIMEHEISSITIPFLDPSLSKPSAKALSAAQGASGVDALGSTGQAELSQREQRRLARARFDLDTFARRAPASQQPSCDRLDGPLTRLHGSPRGVLRPTGVLSTSLRASQRRLEDDGRRPPNAVSRMDSDVTSLFAPGASSDTPRASPSTTMTTDSPSVKSSKGGTSSTRRNSVATDVDALESTAEDSTVEDSREEATGNGEGGSGSVTEKDSLASRPMSPDRSTATSVRSLSPMVPRFRPLEPLGKSKASLGTFSSTSISSMSHAHSTGGTDYSSDGGETTTSAHTTAASVAGIGGTLQPHKTLGSRLGASWLWTSIVGDRSGKGQEEKSAAAALQKMDSSTSLGKRKVGGVATPPRASVPLPKETSAEPSKSSGAEETASQIRAKADTRPSPPKPISIQTDAGGRGRSDSAYRNRAAGSFEDEAKQETGKSPVQRQQKVNKQMLINPSNPSKNLAPLNPSQTRRWQHLFPRPVNRHTVKWKSMCTPACLPLTTDYFPSPDELRKLWQEYPFTVTISSDTTSVLLKPPDGKTPRAKAFMREMVSQRLAQGFQFIVSPEGLVHLSEDARKTTFATGAQALEEGKLAALRPASETLNSESRVVGVPIYLSMSNHIHRLSYDPVAQTVEVKRYVRRIGYSTEPVDYSCMIWSRHAPGYHPVQTRFSYPNVGAYNWNYLDSLISGFEEELTDSLRYWRTRFILIPSEVPPNPMKAPTGEPLSDEEIRLLGTDKLAELFAKARWLRPGERPERFGPPRFFNTSLDPSTCLGDENLIKSMAEAKNYVPAGAPNKVLKGSTLAQIAKEMRSERTGVRINDRLWHRILYADTFIGFDFVTWLCRTYRDVRTREDAVEWGIKLQKDGLFEHVNKVHGFLDGHYFYRLKGEYALPRASKSWFGSTKKGSDAAKGSDATSDSSDAEDDAGRADMSDAVALDGDKVQGKSDAKAGGAETRRSGAKSKPVRKAKLEMSKSIIIDVDPARKSDRAEIAFLHHDLAHNPANSLSFQIHWLGTTTRFIEDMLQGWSRTIEKYGLRLVEAPVEQVKDIPKHNPFQSTIPIPLAFPPPPESEYESRLPEKVQAKEYLEYALLRKFNFVLDSEAADRFPKNVQIVYSSRREHFDHTQFIHRSGVAFVQVIGGSEGFIWLPNRLFTSRHWRGAPDPDALRKELEAFCSNKEALERFWKETIDALPTPLSTPSLPASSSGSATTPAAALAVDSPDVSNGGAGRQADVNAIA